MFDIPSCSDKYVYMFLYTCFYTYIKRSLCSNVVQLSGATGTYANNINGYYEPTDEVIGYARVYKKLGGADVCVSYYASEWKWVVSDTSDKGSGTGWAWGTVSPPRPLEDCPRNGWEVWDGTCKSVSKEKSVANIANQPSFSVSKSSKASFEAAYAAQV